MTNISMNLIKGVILASFLLFAESVIAQDGTIYPLETPDEPNAILLDTGNVDTQPAPETWFRQWGDQVARNISTATLTNFLPYPDKSNGAALIAALGCSIMWLCMDKDS